MIFFEFRLIGSVLVPIEKVRHVGHFLGCVEYLESTYILLLIFVSIYFHELTLVVSVIVFI